MVATLKALGIDTEKDLFASDMVSNFRTYFLKGKEVLKSKQYSLLVHDAVMAAKVFSALENAGISNANIERTEYKGLESIKLMLRSKALMNAKLRAEALTKPLQQTVGTAVHIADLENYNILEGRSSGTIRLRGIASVNEAVVPAKIEFEKIKITANVNVKFLLK